MQVCVHMRITRDTLTTLLWPHLRKVSKDNRPALRGGYVPPPLPPEISHYWIMNWYE